MHNPMNTSCTSARPEALYNQVGQPTPGDSRRQRSCRAHFMRAGASAPGGAEPAWTTRGTFAARAISLNSACTESGADWLPPQERSVTGTPAPRPSGAKAPARLKWAQQEHRPTGFLAACGLGGLRLLVILLLCVPSFLCAQAPATNRVLQLTDDTSHVELPSNIFDSLTQATIEGWVKWDRLRVTDRFFDFGDKNHEIYVRSDGPQLNFLITDSDGSRHRLEVAGILKSGEWMHIAAVSGPGGAKLYCNGVLAGTHATTASFSGLKGIHNYLAKSNYSSRDPSSRGAMDEVRVWDHERTGEQIRHTVGRHV